MGFPVDASAPWAPVRTGILMTVVPPVNDTVDIEVYLKTTGTTGYNLLDTIKSELIGAGTYSFLHQLPLTTESFSYKARSIAVGRWPSTFTGIITARPRAIPRVVFGVNTPAQPVLGQAQTIHSNYALFAPETNGTTYSKSAGYLTPGTLGVTANFDTAFDVPAGSTLGNCRIRLWRNGILDSATCLFQKQDASGGVTLGTTLTATTGAAYATYTDTSFAGTIVSQSMVIIAVVSLSSVSVLSDTRCLWGEVDFVPTSYRQVRG